MKSDIKYVGMKQMRFLFITHSAFSQYSCYKRAIGTGEALTALGHEVYILVKDCAENRTRIGEEAPHCNPIYVNGGIFREVIAKLRALWRVRPDVIYLSAFSVHNLAGMHFLFPRARSIIEFNELYSEYPRKRRNWALWELIALFEHKYILCASVFLTRHFSDVSRKYFLKRNIIYSPFAFPDYLRPSRSVHERKTILFMASLWKGYGIYEVLQAFELIVRKGAGVALEVIGKGEEYERVKEWVEEHKLKDDIHICGFVAEQDLNEHFSKADVFVSPMHDTLQDWARCPSKIFYYIPYQKPIVTCKIGNPFDVLGEYGFYYRSGDVEDMAMAFIKAIEACDDFVYPEGFVEQHSWASRAKELEKWITNE